jgi:hypothetical protein
MKGREKTGNKLNSKGKCVALKEKEIINTA